MQVQYRVSFRMTQEKAAEIIELNAPRAGDSVRREVDDQAGDTPSANEPNTEGLTAGEILARARKKAGLSHAAVSEGTKIKESHLVAIEASDAESLPSTPFAVGFVKAYAQFLGLDGEALAHQFREEIGATAPPPEEIAERLVATPSYASDGARLVSVLGIGAIVIFAIWIAFQILGPKDARDAPRADADRPRVTLGTAPAGASEPAPTEIAARNTASEAPALSEAPAATDAAASETLPAPESVDAVAASADAETTVADTPVEEPAIDGAAEQTADSETLASLAETQDQPEAIVDPVLESVIDDAPITDEPPPMPDLISPEPETATLALNEAETQAIAVATESAPAAPPVEPPLREAAPEESPQNVIVDARLTRGAAPRYPDRCDRNAAPRESVTVIFDVNPTGRVANARVVDTTNSCFNSAAVLTVKRWRFSPRTVNGQPRPETAKRATINFDQ